MSITILLSQSAQMAARRGIKQQIQFTYDAHSPIRPQPSILTDAKSPVYVELARRRREAVTVSGSRHDANDSGEVRPRPLKGVVSVQVPEDAACTTERRARRREIESAEDFGKGAGAQPADAVPLLLCQMVRLQARLSVALFEVSEENQLQHRRPCAGGRSGLVHTDVQSSRAALRCLHQVSVTAAVPF